MNSSNKDVEKAIEEEMQDHFDRMEKPVSKPCDEPCPTCGSSNIYLRFFEEGEDTHLEMGPSKRRNTTEFVNRTEQWVQRALKDTIVHTCRCCNYQWDGPPLAPREVKNYQALYEDLVLQVATVFPNETRHETAKRYIVQCETGANSQQEAAKDGGEDKNHKS